MLRPMPALPPVTTTRSLRAAPLTPFGDGCCRVDGECNPFEGGFSPFEGVKRPFGSIAERAECCAGIGDDGKYGPSTTRGLRSGRMMEVGKGELDCSDCSRSKR